MSIDSVVDVSTIPRIAHTEAMAITAVENDRFAAQLRDLGPDDWSRSTDCTLWTVHDIAAHIVGSAAGQASPVEFVRQVRRGKPLIEQIGGKYWWDGMNQVQVNERRSATSDELIAEWDVTAVRALKARTSMPRLITRLPLLNLPAPVGRQPVAYLFDMGFTRDVWAHRIDVAMATGKAFAADDTHDGRILADLVSEWGDTHGQPFQLELDGPFGGRFRQGSGGETVRTGTLDFVRTLAQRLPGTGVLTNPLPL